MAKIIQYHIEKLTNTAIARRLHLSVSVVQRQLEKFNFKKDYKQLPQVLSWDEFSRNKGKLAFIAQDYETKEILAILDNTRQTTRRIPGNCFRKIAENYRIKYFIQELLSKL